MFRPYSTMKQVAELAGEPESDHPRTACPVATKFILSMEIQMNHNQQRELSKLVPVLKNSRKPKRSKERLDFLVEKAIRKYAQESLRESGAYAAAATIRDEPDTQQAGELARQFAPTLREGIPRELRTKSESRRLSAARAAETAASATRALSESDPTLQDNAAQYAAYAMSHWTLATQKDIVRETIALMTDMLAMK